MPEHADKRIDESRKWAGRPVVAFVLRTLVYVVPIVASVSFSIWMSRTLARPDSLWGIVGWFGLLVAVSTLVLFLVDKLARKALPLAALLAVSMVFPDQSPSRFKTALKSGSSSKNLKALIAEAESLHDDDIAQSAELVLSLTTALNAHDPRTRGHAERVRAYTDMLAEEMGLSEEDRAKLRWSSVLHDIGKLKVSTDILNKPGKLDDEEWAQIKLHPVHGESMCGPLLEWLGDFAGAIRHHHERFDGNGYPDGLKGEEITRAGRIVCVADAYDVMTSVRSYKKPMPNDAAREELARHAGTQFDPEVVRAFLRISMGRLRWVAGPLSWLAQLPFLNVLGGVAQNVGATVSVAAAAGTVSAAVIGAGIVEIPIDSLDLLPVPETLQQYVSETPVAFIPTTTPTTVVVGGPAAANDRFEVVAGAEPIRLDVLANDTGVANATLAIVSQPGFGTVVINADGTVTYIPQVGYDGPDSFVYAVSAADGTSSQGVVELGVTVLNTEPVATNDVVVVDEDGFIVIDVLGNDIDAEGFDVTSVTVTTLPVSGEATVLDDGRIRYVPDPDFYGTDTITYTATDLGGLTASATITITVTPVNDPPLIAGEFASVDEDGIVIVDVVANDSDSDGSIVAGSVTITSPPIFGVATPGSDGTITYVPYANVNGSDIIGYQVCDSGGACGTANLVLTIAAVNDPPLVAGEFASVVEDGIVVVDVVANDSDSDGSIVAGSVTVTSPPVFGVATPGSDGTITYVPYANVNGSDIVVYSVCDSGGACGTANLVVTIAGVNDAPTVPGPGSLAVTEDETATFDPLAGASDVDGDTVTVASFDATSAAGGSIVAGSLVYTPPANYTGTDTFTYTITDGTVLVPMTVTITVTDLQHAPVPGVVPTSLVEDGALTIDPAAAAGDADGETITVIAVAPASNGSTVVNPDGTVTYTPIADFNGTDSFTYTISDGIDSVTGTVTVTVTNVNDPPVVVVDAATVAEDAAFFDINVLANDSDVDGDTLVAVADTTGLVGATVTGLGAGVFRVSPAADFDGTAMFGVTVSDGSGGSGVSTVTFTMTPSPDAPVAGDDAVVLDEDTMVVIAPLVNDSDVDTGDSLSVLSIDTSGIVEGSLVDHGDGTFTYTAREDHHGTESFDYTISDTFGLSDTATVTITIDPMPDAPTAGLDGFLTDQDTTLVVVAPGLLSNDIDHDDEPLTVDLVPVTPPTNGTLLLSSDGSFTYDPNLGFTGTDTFTYTVRDPGGLTDSGTVTVTVNSGVLGGFLYLGDTPDPSGGFLLSSIPPVAGPPADPVPDFDSDGNPGVTIVASGGGLGEMDPSKFVTWSHTPVAPLELDGPFFLDLWSTSAGYAPFEAGHIVMYVLDCDALVPTSCVTLIDNDTHRRDWNGGVASWVNETFTIGSVQHTINVGRTLVLRAQFKHGNVWIANTTDYPSRFVFTQANRPPVTVDDVHPDTSAPAYLEDSPKVNIDVIANDFDADLDPGSLWVLIAPGFGTATPKADGTIDYTPDPDKWGTDTLVYEICDTNGECSMATLSVTVTPVNDVPSFVAGPDITVLEDSGGNTVSNWATVIDLGANEPAQKLDNLAGDEKFEVVVPIPAEAALFEDLPTIDKNGDLKFKPADDALGTANVSVSLRDDGGTTNGGVDQGAVVSFSITFDPVNDEPRFTKGPDVSVAEDSGAYPSTSWATAISVGPANEAGQLPTFIIDGNDDPALFAVQPFIDPAGFLTFTPAGNANGTARIDIHLEDDGGIANGGDDTSPTEHFDITVTAVNDQPTLDPIPDPAPVLEDAATQSVSLSGISAGGGESDVLAVTAVSSNPLVVTSPVVTYTSPSATGSLDWTPVPNAVGTATITVIVDDNSGAPNATVSETFDITIDPVNDAPTVSVPINVSRDEDAGLVTIAGFVSMASSGPAESDGVDSFIVTATGVPTVTFAQAPAVDAAGELTFQATGNDFGSATFTVAVKDDGGTADGGLDTSSTEAFTITIDAVNDQPSFTHTGDETVLEDAGLVTVAGFGSVSSFGPGESTQSVAAYVVTPMGVPTVTFSTAPTVDATGELTFQATANESGSATFDVQLRDNGGIANGGVDLSVAQSFTITVTGVNDQPTLDAISDVSVAEDPGAQSTSVSGISAGGGESDTLTVSAVSSNPAIVPHPTVAYTSPNPTGSLAWTPVLNATGTVTITVTVDDNTGAPNATVVRTFDITVTPVNDAPTVTPVGPFSISEDAGIGVVVGVVTATDPDSAVTGFSIASGDPLGVFIIGPTGIVRVGDPTNLDYETTMSYSLGITATDGIDTSLTETVVVNVVNVNDVAPTVTPGQILSVSENSPNTTVVGTVAATDLDSPITGFAIAGGDPLGVFAIDATGQVSVVDNATLDFETTPQYLIAVTASDGVFTSSVETVTVDVVDSAERILISELRTVGPTGSSDEFIELYNASSIPVNIEGWEIRVDDANLLQVATIVIDSNDDGAATSAVVPANGFYLLGGALYTGGPSPDQTFVWDVTMGAGIGLYDAASNPIDAVGTSPAWKSGAGALYVEGTPLAPIDGFQDHSYQRRNGDAFGACGDSDDNAADFVHLLDQSTPRNSSSPLQPCAVLTPPPPVVPPLSVVISEFRIDGPTGGNDDQFVEFFNPTGASISMNGWSLWLNEPASARFMFSFGPAAVIPPGRHLLLAGGGYSSPTLVLPDAYFDANGPTPYGVAANTTPQNEDGFILVMGADPTFDPIVDVVALDPAAYLLEGSNLPPLGGRVIQSYERFGGCRDTNANSLDFVHNVASEKPQNLSSAAESC